MDALCISSFSWLGQEGNNHLTTSGERLFTGQDIGDVLER
jgi:hypothetical protein